MTDLKEGSETLAGH
jgi:hypothetical protein